MTFRTETFPYFDGQRPRILAHRGLHNEFPENSRGSFRAAVDIGIEHIETDVVASRDGVAMISHDLVLDRISDATGPVAQFSAAELERIDVGGEGFITLETALAEFPTTRFNIDVKDAGAIDGVVRAINATNALNRVLLTSFSGARRRRVTRELPTAATSASAPEFIAIFGAARLGLTPLLPRVQAIQIPAQVGRIPTVTAGLVSRYHRAGLEVHVWTVNEETEMRRLLALGVDGIVTDRADIAKSVIYS